MQHITGISRNQMTFSSLEDTISVSNPIRFVDAFVEHVDLIALDFDLRIVKSKHSLIMLVYNIKRTINILGVPDLIAKIKNWKSPYKTKVLLLLKTDYLTLKLDFVFCQTKFAA